MGGGVTWRGVQTLASSDSIQVWNYSLQPLSYVIDLSVTMALSLKMRKKKENNSRSHPCRPIHFSLFPPQISVPSPPVNIPFCLYISFPPFSSFSSSLPHWLDHKVSWQMTRISDRNLETLVVVPSHPTSFCASLCLFGLLELCPNLSQCLTDVFLLTEQQIEPQLDPEILGCKAPTQPPPSTLGCSLCQNVSHIKDKTMTLCNILWIWALISGSHTAWLCMTLSRWGKSLRGTRSQIVPWVYYPLSRDLVMPGKRAITGVKKKSARKYSICDYLSVHVPTSIVCVHVQLAVACS